MLSNLFTTLIKETMEFIRFHVSFCYEKTQLAMTRKPAEPV